MLHTFVDHVGGRRVRARGRWGFAPTGVEEGLAHTAAWLRH